MTIHRPPSWKGRRRKRMSRIPRRHWLSGGSVGRGPTGAWHGYHHGNAGRHNHRPAGPADGHDRHGTPPHYHGYRGGQGAAAGCHSDVGGCYDRRLAGLWPSLPAGGAAGHG